MDVSWDEELVDLYSFGGCLAVDCAWDGRFEAQGLVDYRVEVRD